VAHPGSRVHVVSVIPETLSSSFVPISFSYHEEPHTWFIGEYHTLKFEFKEEMLRLGEI
jgi:hypothetical protein